MLTPGLFVDSFCPEGIPSYPIYSSGIPEVVTRITSILLGKSVGTGGGKGGPDPRAQQGKGD